MTGGIAIVGMACRFGDARSPAELWDTVLAQRCAFRRIPDERLRLAEYGDDGASPDGTYVREAAVLDNWEFDRVAFHVPGDTFRATDLVHWLALEVARDALDDAGFRAGDGLPRESTGVLVGNTLTGEFVRAHMLRVRWPFVRRIIGAALTDEATWSAEQRGAFLDRVEARYKAPFPVPGPDSLAGALSNTIAGRICNFFDLSGGGYTVDGACASSLLAIANACTALVNRDLDVAIAGGVDLSLDPFELVGFARVGALARGDMRVYDERSSGFLPGEGCGMLVLMRDEDAVAEQRRRHAVIRGWGISSDGAGGLTRPEADGHLLAMRRAYARAGVDVRTVGYFEGHGTGTPVGDATELAVLSRFRGASNGDRAAIGSIKANIGHTKAAAGVASVIKATLAVEAQLIPPTTGCVEPHAELRRPDAALRAVPCGEPWPADAPLRAGVSAMGFGGINAHVVVDGVALRRRSTLTARERTLLASAQDVELFVVGADDAPALERRLDQLAAIARRISRAELADVAAALTQRNLGGAYRVAIVASTPHDLAQKTLEARAESQAVRIDAARGLFVSRGGQRGQIGFLFPGQGAPVRRDVPALRRRYSVINAYYDAASLGSGTDTSVAQPAIVAASLAALHVLGSAGVHADVAIGHSLGELTALHWAGAMTAHAVLRLATVRGRAMGALGDSAGAMASIAASADDVRPLANGTDIAAYNAPRHTVISGGVRAVEAAIDRARARGFTAHRLPVSHAFHSPLVAAAVAPLAAHLAGETLAPLSRRVLSTVTGGAIGDGADLRALLGRQVTEAVRFLDALRGAPSDLALWIEVGPGHVLRSIAMECSTAPVVCTDIGAPSWAGLFGAVGAAFAIGGAVDVAALFAPRFVRPYDLDALPRLLANPCESAPSIEVVRTEQRVAPPIATAVRGDAVTGDSTFEVVRQRVAASLDLPVESIVGDQRLLHDLHLNSISVAQIAADAAVHLGRAASINPTEFSLSTVAELAAALDARPARADAMGDAATPTGVDVWVRPFIARLVPRTLVPPEIADATGEWRVLSGDRGQAAELRAALENQGGGGLVVCLPGDRAERDLALLLEAARVLLAVSGPRRLGIVQSGGGATAFARALYEEAIGATVCVVDIPTDHPRLGVLVAAELSAAVGFVEAHYDAAGTRRVSLLEPVAVTPAPTAALDASDVVLVTGGAKGITAECVLALARRCGVRLALMGREPETSPTIVAAMRTFADAGVQASYFAADVTDADAVAAAVRRVTDALAPITAVVHGAGINEPRLLADLDLADVRRTLAPKLDGLANVLAAVDERRLRLVAAFGSTIGRRGLRGAASYALANDWMALAMERLQRSLPHCRCLALEWSVWSGVGIGARSGQLDAIARAGITPIAPADGADLFARLVASAGSRADVRMVVCSRYGDGGASLLDFARPPLPPFRFLERTRVHYDGVELVADSDLSVDADPYLADHVLDGRQIFPAVMGLEAMAQAARAVLGSVDPIEFEDVAFDRAVVVPPTGTLTIRVAALVRESGDVDVVLRSAETAYQVDHFRARCTLGCKRGGDATPASVELENGVQVAARPLYVDAFFQRGRFQRVDMYKHLRARACVATLAAGDDASWFGQFHSRAMLLGDAGMRDAAIHALQACLPHAVVIPIGVDRMVAAPLFAALPLVVRAVERAHHRAADHETFVYDVDICDGAGAVIERWEGLRLRTVGARRVPTASALLGPYFERRLAELLPQTAESFASFVTNRNEVHCARDAARATRELLGAGVAVGVRAPSEVVAYSTRLAFRVSGPSVASCDVAEVVTRSDQLWHDLLTPEHFALAAVLGAESGEEAQRACTRVWCAAECLIKAGIPAGGPLVLRTVEPDGWSTFRAGDDVVGTYVATPCDEPAPLAFALLFRSS